MRGQISEQLNKATTVIFVLIAFLLPLFLTTLTTEFFETPKLIFLLVALGLLLLLKGITWVLSGKVPITRTPLDLPLLLFLGIVLISAIFSPLRYIAFFGNLPRIHGSAYTWVLYVLFYFLATSHLRTTGQVKLLLQALLASGTVLALLSITSYFGLFLPFAFAKSPNFTPTGSTFSTNAILVFLLPILLVEQFGSKGIVHKGLGLTLSVVFAIALALTGNLATIATAAIILVFILYARRGLSPSKSFLSPEGLSFLLPVLVFLAVFLLGKAPFSGSIYGKAQSFPRELELPFDTSWKVSAGAFRDTPFFGTGPSTYLFDFTQYKPIEYNSSNLWNIRFDTSFDELLQLFATTGVLGLIAILFALGTVVTFSTKAIRRHPGDSLIVGVALSCITGVILLSLHTSTVVVVVTFFIILATLMALNKSEYDRVEELTIGIKAWNPTRSDLIAGDALPMILLILIVLLVGFTTIKAVPLVAADYHHRQALNAASSQGLTTYNELVKAEQLNPSVDLYRTDLAQTNFALANAIATAKGPTQASPSGSLTDTDKQNIQTLLSQSINEGRAAVTLNPLSAQNWEILASIYRQISGVAQNALTFSLDAYGRAIQLDPLNPLLRLSVGGVYYSVKNYSLAARFFSDSVNLKPDFANGYYNLAIAARDAGDLQTAVAAAQQVVTIVDKSSPDYKTATQLLSDLQAAAQKQQAQSNQQTPPAAQQTSALQNQNLPNVLNLNQPQNVATPAAVPSPKPSPSK